MNSIQKKFFGRCLVVVLMVCLFHMNASAADIKFENYRVKSRKGGCVVFVEGNKKLLTIVAQIHMPKGPEGQKHTWKNFSWSRRASIEKQGDLQVIHGKCAYKEDLVTVQADVEMDYRIEVSPEGKLFLFYDFLNKGDEIYMEPHLKITFNYDLLKGQKWAVEKVEGKDKDGVWKEKVVHGMKSISWKTNKYNRIDTRVLSCVLDTRLGKPLKIDLSPETHLRLHGGGRATLYNINNFAGVNTAYDWKRMKKGETFSVEADIDLPVEPSPEKATEAGSKNTPSKKSVVTKKNENINCFAYEDKNKPVRPKIKNGTFYRDGKPVFMVGACKKLVRKPDQFPIEEYRKYPAYTQTIDYGIARKAGFNCLHPRVVPWPIGEQLDPDHPTLSKGFIQWRVDNFPDFIKSLKTLPLVTGYALVCKLSRFTSEDLAQKKGGWHNYVPFCPENPKGKKIYRDFWQYGAKLLLENGGNPWIYELFNEPTYDCRCKYNRQDFVQWLKKKYGGLRNVNRKWGASFQTFEGIIEDTRFERNKGLWVDWLKFIENRWCEILKEGMQAVREVDKRDKVYFSSQRAIIPSFLRTGNGFDEYKTARVLDVVTTEGGIHFSPGGSGAKSDDPFAAHLQGKMRMQLDIARAAAEGKPVIDNEQSTRRFDETGKRIPSKREDLTLMLWNEAIHGSSAVQIFHWHNRAGWWPTPDLEGACKFVNNPNHGWARTCLTNPYNYPKPTLKGIIDFNEEIAKLAEVVLPRPRIKGKIALLLSNPSRRYTRDISKPFTVFLLGYSPATYIDSLYEPDKKRLHLEFNNPSEPRQIELFSRFLPETIIMNGKKLNNSANKLTLSNYSYNAELGHLNILLPGGKNNIDITFGRETNVSQPMLKFFHIGNQGIYP
jgi:hypothetical protein